MSSESVARYLEAATGRPMVLVQVELQPTHLAVPTPRIWTGNFIGLARKFRLISVERLTFGQQTARLHGRGSRR
jgi:hypothetical protein